MQKILITGANGHLGANLVRVLIGDGAEVRVLLRPESDNSPTDDMISMSSGCLAICAMQPRLKRQPRDAARCTIALRSSPPHRAASRPSACIRRW